MNSPYEEQILDACLSEALGGPTPPDLSARILRAYEAARTTDHNVATQPCSDRERTSLLAAVAKDPKQDRPFVANRRVVWSLVCIAASVAIVTFVVGPGKQFFRGQQPLEVASPSPAPDTKGNEPTHHRNPVSQEDGKPNLGRVDASSSVRPGSVANASNAAADGARFQVESSQAAHDAVVAKPPAAVNNATAPPQTPAPGPKDSIAPEGRMVASLRDEEIVSEIDRFIRGRWEDEGLKPSTVATDAEWCRRVTLDLIGRIPTLEESSQFLTDRSSDKRSRYVDRLLHDDGYVEEFARNWTNVWTTLLVGRSGGMEPGSLVNRDGLQQFLRRAFLTNKPYDRFVRELVSAEGSNTPGEPDFNGAVNFLLDNLQEKGVPATAKTARLFLGVQVQCTQCHNHPFNEWKQDQFWELNAFFRQAQPIVRKQGREVASIDLTDVDFGGDEGNSFDEAEVYWETRNGLMKASYPRFVDGQGIAPAGRVEQVNRRDELAALMLSSRHLPRAMVNRTWAHFLGYGFTRPVDDMGPHNRPSHPELLDFLSEQFAAGGFDLKRLIRWVTMSEAYSLSSRMPKSTRDDPAAGQTPLFSYFYLRRMRPEELYESLRVASGLYRSRQGFQQEERDKSVWLQQFTTAFDTDENDESTTFDGGIPQALMMFNGELMQQATRRGESTFLGEVAASNLKANAKVSQLFHAALGRNPTATELRAALELWQRHQGDESAALEDLWWAVLNSNEFIFNH